jgi:hypothetical protein
VSVVFSENGTGDHPAFYSIGIEEYFIRVKRQRREAVPSLNLLPEIRTSEAKSAILHTPLVQSPLFIST